MLFSNSLFLNRFVQSIVQLGSLNQQGSSVIHAYSGTVPQDSSVVAGVDLALYEDSKLATFNDFRIDAIGNALALVQMPLVNPVLGLRQGTISWAALSGQNDIVLLLQPSLIGGSGSIIFDTLSVTVGGPLKLTDTGISVLFFN